MKRRTFLKWLMAAAPVAFVASKLGYEHQLVAPVVEIDQAAFEELFGSNAKPDVMYVGKENLKIFNEIVKS